MKFTLVRHFLGDTDIVPDILTLGGVLIIHSSNLKRGLDSGRNVKDWNLFVGVFDMAALLVVINRKNIGQK